MDWDTYLDWVLMDTIAVLVVVVVALVVFAIAALVE